MKPAAALQALYVNAMIILAVVMADVALSIGYGKSTPGTYTILLSVITWAGGHGSGYAIGVSASRRDNERKGD